MIISNNNIQQAAKAYGNQTKLSKPAKRDGDKVAVKQQPDEVILSTHAQEFSGMIRKLQALPDVRADKVGELSEQVARGSYHVDAYEIAGRILSEGKEK